MTHGTMSLKFTRYSCQILVKLELSIQSLEKYSNMKFHENPSNGSPVVPCGQTDRRTQTRETFVTNLRLKLCLLFGLPHAYFMSNHFSLVFST